MENKIILMDDKAEKPVTLAATTFSALGKKEVQDLEKWVIANPDILGIDVKIITDEYDHFDKADLRLDLLAIDRQGSLVIIELKRDVKGTLADLQAIRYAAFCSSMTFQDVVSEFADFLEIGTEEASQKLTEFVRDPEFKALKNQPRIVLAAGTFDDPAITSCVLWLRSFGVDISCVEITPYRLPDDRIALVPRVIIPLPETKDFMVGIERKAQATKDVSSPTLNDLLTMADNGGVRDLVDICRQVAAFLPGREIPNPVYGGSLSYWVSLQDGRFHRGLFGINIANKRSRAAAFGLDVWISPANLRELTPGVDESAIRGILAEDFQAIERGHDSVIHLSDRPQAEKLVHQLKEWVRTSKAREFSNNLSPH